MKTTYVTLRIMDDDDSRPWWEALCLPDPSYWSANENGDPFAPNTLVRVSLEVQEAKPAA